MCLQGHPVNQSMSLFLKLGPPLLTLHTPDTQMQFLSLGNQHPTLVYPQSQVTDKPCLGTEERSPKGMLWDMSSRCFSEGLFRENYICSLSLESALSPPVGMTFSCQCVLCTLIDLSPVLCSALHDLLFLFYRLGALWKRLTRFTKWKQTGGVQIYTIYIKIIQ